MQKTLGAAPKCSFYTIFPFSAGDFHPLYAVQRIPAPSFVHFRRMRFPIYAVTPIRSKSTKSERLILSYAPTGIRFHLKWKLSALSFYDKNYNKNRKQNTACYPTDGSLFLFIHRHVHGMPASRAFSVFHQSSALMTMYLHPFLFLRFYLRFLFSL